MAVQLFVDPGLDHASLLQRCRRVVFDQPPQLVGQVSDNVRRTDLHQGNRLHVRQSTHDLGQVLETGSQSDSLARRQGLQDGSRHQPLQIPDTSKKLPHLASQLAALQQLGNRIQAIVDRGWISQGTLQPLAQQPPSRGRDCFVENPEQGSVSTPFSQASENLQIGDGSRVQHQVVQGFTDSQLLDVGKVVLLRFSRIAKGGGSCLDGRLVVVQTEALQGRCPHLLAYQLHRLLRSQSVFLRFGRPADVLRLHPFDERLGKARRRVEDLLGSKQGQIVERILHPQPTAQKESSRRDIQKGSTTASFIPLQARKVVGLGAFQQLGIADRSGRDDPRHFPFDQALGLCRVLDLIADRHFESRSKQFAEVHLDRMMRHATHRCFVLLPTVARRERHFQNRSRPHCILEEHLVKVAHPIHEDGILVVGLDLEILAEHRGELDGARHDGSV